MAFRTSLLPRTKPELTMDYAQRNNGAGPRPFSSSQPKRTQARPVGWIEGYVRMNTVCGASSGSEGERWTQPTSYFVNYEVVRPRVMHSATHLRLLLPFNSGPVTSYITVFVLERVASLYFVLDKRLINDLDVYTYSRLGSLFFIIPSILHV